MTAAMTAAMRRLGQTAWVIILLGAPGLAIAEHTRVTNPNSLGVEVLGRGLMYSVFYDRVATDDLVAGIGWGGVSLQTVGGVSVNATVGTVPVYANYYFTRDGNSLFATGGVTILRKFHAGVTVPAHIHPLANESAYVLSGEWEESGAVYTTGAFFFAPKGVKHGPHHAKTEVISLTVFDGPLTVTQ